MTDGTNRRKKGKDQSWRGLLISSWVMSLCLFGDALIYIVLPVNAEQFGVSLVWVGILLSANRIIRTFTYGWIAHLSEWIGLRNLCILASSTAVLSTAGYGFLEGGWPLLAARVLWGLSYAGLLLVTLAYAAQDRAKTGTRVGVSRAVEQIGPLVAMTAGTWLAGIVGAKDVFLYLALGSALILPLSVLLPNRDHDGPPTPPAARPSMFPKPDRFDLLIFWMGVGVDGVFTLTITIILAQQTTVELAMLGGGLILSVRRIAEMVAAPTFGAIADRFGVRRPLIVSSVLVIIGFALLGSEWLIVGSIAVVLGRGALGTLFPTAVAYFAQAEVLQPLARNQTWRDIGAAVGPIATGFLLHIFKPQDMLLALAFVYTIFFIWLMMSPVWHGDRR